MKKRLGSMLLTLAMVLTLAPAGVVPVRASSLPKGGGELSGAYNVQYASLSSGHYTLSGDVTLTGDALTIKDSAEVWIDLNGHSITGATGTRDPHVIEVRNGGILNLVGNGTIRHDSGAGGCGVYILNSTFNMYGGEITGNRNNRGGGGVYIDGGGKFNLFGGMIYNNAATSNYTIAPPAEAYTVTYAPGKGSGTMDAGTATEGAPFTLPECTFTAPAAYKGATKGFAGWKIGDTDTIVSTGGTYIFTGDTTVTATWRTDVAGNYQIFVKTLSGRSLTLNVIQGATIAQIKSVIEDKLDVPPAQQHLTYQDTLLEDDWTLGRYNIQKEATLNMVCTVTVTNDGHGTGSASPAFGASNTPVTLTAEPTSGYHFKEWQVISGGVTINGNSFTIGTADVEIKAVFEADAPAIIPVTGVALNKPLTTLPVGGTETLTATVAPANATNQAVTWSSDNESAATVTDGVVTAVAAGTAAITVTTVDGSKTATCDVTVTAPSPAAYTVTFDANGGAGTMAAQTVSGTAALSTNAFTRSGCTFNGWNTAADGSGTSYANTASITPTADLTLYAQWKPSSSGSNAPSGGNGGYSPATTTTGATETVPVSGESGSVSVSVTVSGDTATVKAPTTAELNKVIGESVKTGDIVMDLRELNKGIATASIPAETVRAIEKAVSDPDNDAGSLTIKLTDGSVTFDDKALAAVAEQMKDSNLQLHLDGVGTSGLKAAQKSAIKAMDVQTVYDIYLTSNGVRVTDFKGGSATVTVTYTLKDGQRGGGVVVWYVADGGKMEEIPTRSNRDEVTFTVAHFSNYAVVYDAERAASSAQSGYADCPRDAACPISTFKDTDPTEWYHDGVHWAIENSVMNGVGDGLFLQNGTTTRAQVATMLYRLAGSPQVSGESAFTDVAEGMWYTDAICWAAAQGVVTGFERDGMTVFDPNAAVTREQLAAMLYRCAKLNGQGFTGAWMFLLDYPDAADVSEWADEAMHWVIMKGIINGMDGRLKPQGSATRAQTATIFMRYFTASAE